MLRHVALYKDDRFSVMRFLLRRNDNAMIVILSAAKNI